MSAPRPLVVVGVGGFGREALDVIEAVNALGPRPVYDVRGVLDDAPSESNARRLSQRGVAYLGHVRDGVARLPASAAYVLGIGNPAVRAQLDDYLLGQGVEPATVIHPGAGIGSAARIGPGAVICAGVQVSTNVALGRSVHLNPNATIGHDAALDDFVSVNPGAVVSGECRVHEGTLIGAGAVVLQGLTVGAKVVVGAAACVTRNVPADATVTGVPAR